MALLELKHITKRFGEFAALSDINFTVDSGELVGLVGPNGSGKSTLFNVISGFYEPSEGQVIYSGENLVGMRPDTIATRRLIRIFQSNVLFKDVSVFENVVIGCYMDCATGILPAFFNLKSYRGDEQKIRKKAGEILELWGLYDVRNVMADELPHGDQRKLAIAVAFAANPKLLLLDEPVAGMSETEMAFVIGKIKELAKKGITVILVEHHVKTVMDFCDRLFVLNYGTKIADGPAHDVIANKKVIEAYLGEPFDKQTEVA